MKLDRLLAIVVLLLNKDRVSAKALAGQFDVSIRTIHRDLEAINQSGIPIVAYQGYNGGYSIMENYKLNKNVLTHEDLTTIITALKGIGATVEDRRMKITLEKIMSLIPENDISKIKRLHEQMTIDVSPWGNSEAQKWKIGQLRHAIENNRLICFFYTNLKGEGIQRTVEPMTLVLKGYAWYLYGYCTVREDYRLFKLSRVQQLNVTDAIFSRRNMSYDSFTEEADWVKTAKWVEVVLRFNPRARSRVEELFDSEAVHLDEDGTLLVKAVYPEDEWVYSNILSFGEDVVVLGPPHIRRIIKEKCKRMIAQYK